MKAVRGVVVAREMATWLEPLPVRDWMRRPVVTVRSDTLARAAAEMMRARRIRHLPVTDARGRLVGIVTDRDLRQVVFDPAMQERLRDLPAVLEELAVSRVMTWGVVSVGPTTDLRAAAHLMHEGKIGAVPVVENDRVVGILTESDMLHAFEQALRGRVRRPGPLRRADVDRRYEYGFPTVEPRDPWRDNGEPP
jgi:CBS domain-containing protein